MWERKVANQKVLLFSFFYFQCHLFLNPWQHTEVHSEYLMVFPELSFWSLNTRCLKSSTMRGSPLRRETLGSQPRSSLALVMSGFLLCGSSSVLGLNSIFALGSIVSCTTCTIPHLKIRKRVNMGRTERNAGVLGAEFTWASSSMVNSPGFPRLKGPTWSPSISLIKPSTFHLCKYNTTYTISPHVDIRHK